MLLLRATFEKNKKIAHTLPKGHRQLARFFSIFGPLATLITAHLVLHKTDP